MRRGVLSLLVLAAVPAAGAPAPAPTRVTIDEHRRLLLNGKPWLPLGMSPGPELGSKDPAGRDAMGVLTEAGINCFRVGVGLPPAEEADRLRYLDWAHAHGAYCFPNLREYTMPDDAHPEREARLRAVVQRFRMHPALAMWKSMDEPAWGKQPLAAILRGYRILHESDPDHPVWMNHAPRNTPEELREYCKGCDVTGVDIYPVTMPMGLHSHLPNKELSVVGDYTTWITDAAGPGKAIIMVLQVAFSGTRPPKPRVFPTLHQERYMAYQAIIKGARGLLFYGMNVSLEGRDAELGYNWSFWQEVLAPVIRELGEKSPLHPALLGPDVDAGVQAAGAPGLEMVCREAGGSLYLLAAKREGPEAEVRFTGARLAGEVEVMFEGRRLQAAGGAFTDRFGPNDVHVYRLAGGRGMGQRGQ